MRFESASGPPPATAATAIQRSPLTAATPGGRAMTRRHDPAWIWMIGAFGQPTPRLTWGATLTGRVDATLTGPVEVKYSDDAKSPDTLEGTQTTDQLLPWAAAAGANFDVTPNV